MPYALIPDGYSLKKVTELQKQAVNEKRRHDNVVAFLNNETTPVLIGATGLIAIAPILLELFAKAAGEAGVTLSDEQKEIIKKAWLLGIPGIGPAIIGQDIFKKFFGDE